METPIALRLSKGDQHHFLGQEWRVASTSDQWVHLQRGQQPNLEGISLTWRQLAWQVNEHAINRYIERFGGNPDKRVKIALKLIDHVLDGRPLGGGKFFSRGMVVATYGNRVLTCYKPTKAHIHVAIFRAHQRKAG